MCPLVALSANSRATTLWSTRCACMRASCQKACNASGPGALINCWLLTIPAFCMQVTYAANDDVLVTAGYDQCVKVWDCKSRSIDPIQVMKVFQVRQLACRKAGCR